MGEVRGLGAFWAIELVRNRETREMLVPYNASGPDAKPMQELLAACKERGVWPFIHFNRLHVTPPLTTSLGRPRDRARAHRRRPDGRRPATPPTDGPSGGARHRDQRACGDARRGTRGRGPRTRLGRSRQ